MIGRCGTKAVQATGTQSWGGQKKTVVHTGDHERRHTFDRSRWYNQTAGTCLMIEAHLWVRFFFAWILLRGSCATSGDGTISLSTRQASRTSTPGGKKGVAAGASEE